MEFPADQPMRVQATQEVVDYVVASGIAPLPAHHEQLLWRAMWMNHHQFNTAEVVKLGRSLHGLVSREVS